MRNVALGRDIPGLQGARSGRSAICCACQRRLPRQELVVEPPRRESATSRDGGCWGPAREPRGVGRGRTARPQAYGERSGLRRVHFALRSVWPARPSPSGGSNLPRSVSRQPKGRAQPGVAARVSTGTRVLHARFAAVRRTGISGTPGLTVLGAGPPSSPGSPRAGGKQPSLQEGAPGVLRGQILAACAHSSRRRPVPPLRSCSTRMSTSPAQCYLPSECAGCALLVAEAAVPSG